MRIWPQNHCMGLSSFPLPHLITHGCHHASRAVGVRAIRLLHYSLSYTTWDLSIMSRDWGPTQPLSHCSPPAWVPGTAGYQWWNGQAPSSKGRRKGAIHEQIAWALSSLHAVDQALVGIGLPILLLFCATASSLVKTCKEPTPVLSAGLRDKLLNRCPLSLPSPCSIWPEALLLFPKL